MFRFVKIRTHLFAVAALPVIALGAVACGAGGSVTAGSANPAPANPSTTTNSGSTGSGASSPKAVVIAMVTDILETHYTEACMLNLPPAGMDIATECKKTEVTSALKQLHEAWAKPGVTLPPQSQVDVTKITTSGDSGSVQDTAITVDGHTLHDLMLIGSTGDTSGFSMQVTVKKKDSRWYIGDLNMGI